MNYRHGHTKGKSSKTYRAWSAMLQRCLNVLSASYENYGLRGITVCEDWLSFENFLRDMGESPKGLTIERLDNNRGYYKDNCKWVTRTENTRNRRCTKCSLAKADEIRSLYKTGIYTQGALAKQFSVSRVLISLVVAHKIWRE